MQKISILDMKKLAELHNGKCLTKKYINARTKLKWKCKNNHVWDATPDKIKRGSWCPFCAGNIKSTINEMIILAKQKNGKCLSKKYLNNNSKLTWQCKEGHIWEATPGNIKSGHWCPECYGNIKKSIEDMYKLADERNGKCLSKKYLNVDSKLKWQCSEGHIWKARVDHVKNGSWCPYCSEGLGERICRIFFEQLFNEKFPKSKPKWLINEDGNQMELDGYCKKIKLAFEHQGIQHYQYTEYFHNKENFNKRLKDDIKKDELCKKNDVILIKIPEIPSKLKLNKVKNFIFNQCIKNKYNNIPSDFNSKRIELQNAYISNSSVLFKKIKKIAINNGGKCLSTSYFGIKVPLEFICNNGHRWKAKPDNIIHNKTWCPICNKSTGNLKYTIEDMKKIALKRGGKCLSENYKNNHSKLKWECKDGHIWSTSFELIKRGSWCPICANKKKGLTQKLTIFEMQNLAKNHNGICLSKLYKNNHIRLKWKCEYGHIWEATPHHVKNGTWCPFCANIKNKTASVP